MLYEMNVLVCFSIKTGQSYSQCAAFVSKFWQFHRGNESELAAARGLWTETFRPWAAAPSTGSNSQSAISLSCPASLLQPFLLLQRANRARLCSRGPDGDGTRRRSIYLGSRCFSWFVAQYGTRLQSLTPYLEAWLFWKKLKVTLKLTRFFLKPTWKSRWCTTLVINIFPVHQASITWPRPLVRQTFI